MSPHEDDAGIPPTTTPGWPREEPVIRTIAMPADTNAEGDIFGGWLVSQMDLAGDEVSLFARIARRGRTSLTVSVEAWRRRRDGVDATKVTEGQFTFVAIGEDRKPRPLPPP